MSESTCSMCRAFEAPVDPDLGWPVAQSWVPSEEKATTTFNPSDTVVITFDVDGNPDFDVNPI